MNSLYGRFGLKQEVTNYSFINNNNIENHINQKFNFNTNFIRDIIEFDNLDQSLLITGKIDDLVELISSIPIAAATTAYARMELADILLDEDLDILYLDTDSYKSHQKITELPKYAHLDHNELGGLKYEGTFEESLFLLPKVYGGIYKDKDEEFVKIKGFKDKLEFDKLKNMLFNNENLLLTHDKMYRDWIKSTIKIQNTPYKLSLIENKRKVNLKTLTTTP
jgi:hypothetical protein